MPGTRTRATVSRRSQLRRQQASGRFARPHRQTTRKGGKRRASSEPEGGVLATLSRPVSDLRRRGGRSGSGSGSGRRGLFAALTAAGAGAVAIAKRRSKQREALQPDPPQPAETP